MPASELSLIACSRSDRTRKCKCSSSKRGVYNSIHSKKGFKRSCIVASTIIRIREEQKDTGNEYTCDPCYNSIALVLHRINGIDRVTYIASNEPLNMSYNAYQIFLIRTSAVFTRAATFSSVFSRTIRAPWKSSLSASREASANAATVWTRARWRDTCKSASKSVGNCLARFTMKSTCTDCSVQHRQTSSRTHCNLSKCGRTVTRCVSHHIHFTP